MYPRIKELRQEKRLTQIQLSIKLEMDQSEYSKYERGARTPPITFFIKLARFYGVSVDYIVGNRDDKG